jgi:pimeloyl-ACP methyl ester carboxylesterase
MPYAYNKRVRIYWEEEGQGDPLLMIMGLGFTLAMWGELRAILSRHFRTILLDNRGVGKTNVPRRPFSMGDMARDALCVLDAASARSAHVLGMSMGGMIAQELALANPDRVRKLVLGCTFCGGLRSALPEYRAFRLLTSPFLSRTARLEAIVPLIYDAHTPRERIERDLDTIRANAPSEPGYFQQLAAIVRWHSYGRLPGIASPTLVIHGETDRLVPPANASILANRIPNSRLVLIPDASHIFPTDQPAITSRSLLDFLDGAAPAGG